MPRAYTLADVFQQIQTEMALGYEGDTALLEVLNQLAVNIERSHATDSASVTALSASATRKWGAGRWNEFKWG